MSAAASNIRITLPDGKAMEFHRGVTGAEIAAAIVAKYPELAIFQNPQIGDHAPASRTRRVIVTGAGSSDPS